MIELELLELAYMLKPVRAIVLQSLGSIPGIDTPLQRGSEVTLPLWLAETLEKFECVEIQGKIFTPSEISKLRFQHRQHAQIPKLEEDFFYIKARKSIEDIELRAKRETDYVLIRAVEKAKQDLFEIFKSRFSTILKAIQLEGVNTVVRQLTLEERVMTLKIANLIDEWKRRFIGFVR